LTRRTALHAKDMSTAKMQLEEALKTSMKVKDRRNQGVARKALGDWYWQSGQIDAAREFYEQSLLIRRQFHEKRGEAITLKSLGDLALRERDYVTAQSYLEHSNTQFLELKDLRGHGVTLHSLGILAWEQNNKPMAQNHFEQSLNLLRRVQDRQSEGTLLYTLALWADTQKRPDEAENWYHESLRIVTEVKAAYSIALAREGLADFLVRRYGQQRKRESDALFIEAVEVYELLGRHQDAQRVEERRTGRNKESDKDKFVRALIYDLDEGPNGQGFAFSNEKRYRLSRALG
jgi:tetratricopeptide (TPR) repeat protein